MELVKLELEAKFKAIRDNANAVVSVLSWSWFLGTDYEGPLILDLCSSSLRIKEGSEMPKGPKTVQITHAFFVLAIEIKILYIKLNVTSFQNNQSRRPTGQTNLK